MSEKLFFEQILHKFNVEPKQINPAEGKVQSSFYRAMFGPQTVQYVYTHFALKLLNRFHNNVWKMEEPAYHFIRAIYVYISRYHENRE